MPKNKILFLVPARYQSTRFPGKPLALLNNKPLIGHVMDKLQNLSKNSPNHEIDFCVVTDDERIETTVKSLNFPVVMVSDVTVLRH